MTKKERAIVRKIFLFALRKGRREVRKEILYCLAFGSYGWGEYPAYISLSDALELIELTRDRGSGKVES